MFSVYIVTCAAPLHHCLLILFFKGKQPIKLLKKKKRERERDFLSVFTLWHLTIDLGKLAKFLHVPHKMTS